MSIAAASFSIYAFQELKEQLKEIDELRFIFTSPSFTTEKADKQRWEFYIPRLSRERDLFGSEFEIKLRNELSLKAVAKECAEWIRQKACFKSNRTNENMMGFINVDDVNYMPITGFTTVDLGCERGNNAYQFVQRTDAPMSQFYLNLFDQVWHDSGKLQVVTEQVLDNNTLTEQIKIDEERAKLMRQIESLERQMNASKQPRRKRELFVELQKLKNYHV